MAMPMKEEDGVQEIYTRDHGIVKVDKTSWQDGRFHIVLCPNGAYQHTSGLPVKNEGELVEAFGPNAEDLEKALNWFRNRHDQGGKAPRPIGMHPDGYPVFDDGTVPGFDDLYAYFRPGKGLTGMIVALQDYKDRQGTGGPPKELRQAKPAAELETPQPPVNTAPEGTPAAVPKRSWPAPEARNKERIASSSKKQRSAAQKQADKVRSEKAKARAQEMGATG